MHQLLACCSSITLGRGGDVALPRVRACDAISLQAAEEERKKQHAPSREPPSTPRHAVSLHGDGSPASPPPPTTSAATSMHHFSTAVLQARPLHCSRRLEGTTRWVAAAGSAPVDAMRLLFHDG